MRKLLVAEAVKIAQEYHIDMSRYELTTYEVNENGRAFLVFSASQGRAIEFNILHDKANGHVYEWGINLK
jgi:hypothetical protein